MYTPVIPRYTDDAAVNEFRLETADIRELQSQMNCNTCDSFGSDGDPDEYLDEDFEYRSDIHIIDAEEFFDRFVFN